MSTILNYVLSLLPFNGDKTKLGILLALIQAYQNIVADPSYTTLLSDFTSHQYLAAAVIAIGLIHKYVKFNA